jgi:hypothetical protein
MVASAMFVFAAWMLSVAGCADLQDPGCASDGDCRFGRVCLQGVCAAASGGGGNNTSANNTSANNTSANNTSANNTSANNNDFLGQPCRPTATCGGDTLGCGPDGVCEPICESSATCTRGEVCVDEFCVEPRDCELLEFDGDDVVCFAQWQCSDFNGVGVICEGSTCFCFDTETGEERQFDVEGDVACSAEAFLPLANSECGFGVPEEG